MFACKAAPEAVGNLFAEKWSELPVDESLMKYGSTAEHDFSLKEGVDSFEELRHRDRMRQGAKLACENIWDRQFFVSGKKTMGFAPREAEQGDIICIPLGCYHPLILRTVDEHYINLGEAYVDGFMYGKAIEMWRNGELEVQDFELW